MKWVLFFGSGAVFFTIGFVSTRMRHSSHGHPRCQDNYDRLRGEVSRLRRIVERESND